MPSNLILIPIIIVFSILLFYFLFLLYTDNFSPILKLNVNYTQLKEQPSYQSDLQFYPNMRFNHNNLSYSLDSTCNQQNANNMVLAFQYIAQNTGVLSFYPSSNPDISISCSNEIMKQGEIADVGKGGPDSTIHTNLYNVITKGQIIIYSSECKYNVELHELLHVLGFNHSINKNSIMYPVINCNQVVTNDITNKLKSLYSQPALPDLYFDNVNAVKQGNLLSINFTVINQGLIDSNQVTVDLLEDNKKIKTFDLGKIEFGAGKVIYQSGLRVSYSQKQIELVINDGQEISKDNNVAVLNVESD